MSDVAHVEVIEPEAIDLPAGILAMVAQASIDSSMCAVACQGFLEGRERADRRWRLEVTAARLVAVDPPTD